MPIGMVCIGCKNKRLGATCTAFPRKIPPEIWSGENDHREPFPGDNGIQFEPFDANQTRSED